MNKKDKQEKEIAQKVMNNVNEYVKLTANLLKEGLIFEKTAKKFSNSSAAIYLPKRLIGKTFKVMLVPIEDAYEISEPVEVKPIPVEEKKEEKKETKEVKKVGYQVEKSILD